MTEDILKKMFDYNARFESIVIPKPLTKEIKTKHPEFWGGLAVRVMIECGDVTALLCLFRIDELLRIRWEDVHWEYMATAPGHCRMRLDLHWRKTHQNERLTSRSAPASECF